MDVADFDYLLPKESIAQVPADRRDGSRLMVLHRLSGRMEHREFPDILKYLQPGDCLVLNDSKVIPARLFGEKAGTGARIEVLLLQRKHGDRWECLVRPGRRLRIGDRILFSQEPRLEASVAGSGAEGTRFLEFSYDEEFWSVLDRVGRIPLPPYIERESRDDDRERYQTVYSKKEGSVAAPTAGLHFTPDLLESIRRKGVAIAFVTLHVGIGTFRPVKTERVEDHRMHFEEYQIPEETADAIRTARKAGGRIVAVGTTSARTLESAALADGTVPAGSDSTGIFIYPGYRFRAVDALVTNFHLPRSTLLMLVSAFYDRESVLEAYRTAVTEGYRFFSYGDAMLLL